jgi:hypothetical protein
VRPSWTTGIRYYHPGPAGAGQETSEIQARMTVQDAATVQRLFLNISTYSSPTPTPVFKSRIDGSDGNLTVTPTGTGIVEDTSNADSLSAAATFNWHVNALSSGSLSSYTGGAEWGTAAGPAADPRVRPVPVFQAVQRATVR